jgi:tRNA G10  N-methylase Trm11
MVDQLSLDELLPTAARFHPLHVTFTGGATDPFNRWFHYLEGYSPTFVRTLLDLYAPRSKSLLDPFGGTGTTAFVGGERGVQSAICEVNPLMQFIFETKVAARSLSCAEGSRVSRELTDVSHCIAELLERSVPDAELRRTYHSTFGTSAFFDDRNFDLVLRARTAVDKLVGSHSVCHDLVTVAVLASLIPCSRLKRAGDLRYMTERELIRGVPVLSMEIASRLREMSTDLLAPTPALRVRPLVLAGDVRTLVKLPAQEFDAIVTSPPYINGTNYFRNARLELWFMRQLSTHDDLRYFRDKAITGGINDVTAERAREPVTPSVARVVELLERNAYDRRIPAMVSSYFAEITDVFAALTRHVRSSAPIMVDIGDSNYGGVHVPAHTLFSDCLSMLGYKLVDEVTLRKRRSKNGAGLTQVLLVYAAPESKKSNNGMRPAWRGEWKAFTETPPHWLPPFSARNWGSGLHSLCSYPGKLKPAIANHLVKIFSPEGGEVFDPFAGVGTIPFEAANQGRKAICMELSPAAYTVAAAKLNIPEARNTADVLDSIQSFIHEFSPTPEDFEETSFGLNRPISEYFHRDTLREVLALRRFFMLRTHNMDPSLLLVKAACLHLLHGNRPYAFSRRSHPLTPYAPTGPNEYRPVMPRIRSKVDRSRAEPLDPRYKSGTVYLGDCTSCWPSAIDNLDAIITSPPFFDSTRFHTQNWLRLWLSGWSREDFDRAPNAFVDERQKQSLNVYHGFFRQARERLRPNGVVVLHLGRSSKCDMAKELSGLARRWFRHQDVYDESVAHCESHGLRDKGTVKAHQYLVLY